MRNLTALLRGKLFILWCRFAKRNVVIGKGLKLYTRLEIRGEGRVSIGEYCVVSSMIGNRHHYVTLYTYDPDACITIGNSAGLYAARMSAKFAITIGNDVLIEEADIVDTDFHSLHKDRAAPLSETKKNCSIYIGDRVSIGGGSIVMKGVTVGDGVVIAPCSVVNRSQPAGSLAMGNPAKVVRDLSGKE